MRNLRKGFGIIALVAIMLSAMACSDGGGTAINAPVIPKDPGTVSDTMLSLEDMKLTKLTNPKFIDTDPLSPNSFKSAIYFETVDGELAFNADSYNKYVLGIVTGSEFGENKDLTINEFLTKLMTPGSTGQQEIPLTNISRAVKIGDPDGLYDDKDVYRIYTPVKVATTTAPILKAETNFVEGWIIVNNNTEKNEDGELGSSFNINMKIDLTQLLKDRIYGTILYSGKGRIVQSPKEVKISGGSISAKADLILVNAADEAVILNASYDNLLDKTHKLANSAVTTGLTKYRNPNPDAIPAVTNYPLKNYFGYVFGDALKATLSDGDGAIGLGLNKTKTENTKVALDDFLYLLLQDCFNDLLIGAVGPQLKDALGITP